MTQKTTQNPWLMDVRVRERNLKSGALTEKDLEKQLAALPDVAEQSEAFGTSQPALAPPAHQAMAADTSISDSDVDDEEDDEDEDEPEASNEALNGEGDQ